MAFVNVAATSVDLQSDIEIADDVVESRKESEQRNCSPSEGNSAVVVSSNDFREALQHKTYRQFKCDDKWWRKTVIYEVYVRSFFDSNNDGIGDLKGKLIHDPKKIVNAKYKLYICNNVYNSSKLKKV